MTESDSAPILITGDCGFVGSHVRRELEDARHRQVISLRDVYARGGVTEDPRRPGVETLLSLAPRFSAVIHCAGNPSIRASFEDPLGELHGTIDPVFSLLELIRRVNPEAPLVFLSSSAVYGTATSPSGEDAALTPVSPYGLNKLMTEELIRYYGRVHHLRAAVIRPFSVIGAGQRKQLIWDALSRFKRGEVQFEGGADNLRDFIDVRDVASLVPFAITAASVEVPTFNASTGIGTTVREAMSRLAAIYDPALQPRFGNRCFAGDPRVLVGINSAAKALGWAPRYELDSSLREITAWFLEHDKA